MWGTIADIRANQFGCIGEPPPRGGVSAAFRWPCEGAGLWRTASLALRAPDRAHIGLWDTAATDGHGPIPLQRYRAGLLTALRTVLRAAGLHLPAVDCDM